MRLVARGTSRGMSLPLALLYSAAFPGRLFLARLVVARRGGGSWLNAPGHFALVPFPFAMSCTGSSTGAAAAAGSCELLSDATLCLWPGHPPTSRACCFRFFFGPQSLARDVAPASLPAARAGVPGIPLSNTCFSEPMCFMCFFVIHLFRFVFPTLLINSDSDIHQCLGGAPSWLPIDDC